MTPLSPSPLLILGGRSLVAPYLMDRLRDQGRSARVISRRPLPLRPPMTGERVDLQDAQRWRAPAGAQVISLLPLWVLADALPRFRGVRQIVAIGSTSLFGKAVSEDPKERALSERLAYAEKKIAAFAGAHGISVTLLRATMIYDGWNDKNIARIARIARRYGIMPLANPALGLRQPIHADDVAAAAVAALDNPRVMGRSLNIAGGEILTYRAMCERVFLSMGTRPTFIPVNTTLLKTAFQWGQKTGLLRENTFGYGVFARMNQDLVFPLNGSMEMLGLRPRSFDPYACHERR